MRTRLILLGLLASAHTWAAIPQQDTDLIGAWVSQTQTQQAQDQYDLYALSIYRADHSYNESVIVKGSQECTLIKTQGTWAYTSPTLSLTLKDSNMPHAMSAGSIARKTILQAEAAKLKAAPGGDARGGVKWLAQGTIYPDVVESGGTKSKDRKSVV